MLFCIFVLFYQKVSTENGSSPTSLNEEREREQPEYSLVDALLALTKSEVNALLFTRVQKLVETATG